METSQFEIKYPEKDIMCFKKQKDFASADGVREELLSMGIIIEDTREGVKWKRK